MIEKGPAKKVTIWVNEDTRHHQVKLWLAVFEYLQHKRVAGASVTRTQMSFGDRKLIHRADAPETPEYAYRIEFVEGAARVDEVLPTLYEMVVDGMIEVQDTTVIKDVNQSKPAQDPGALVRRQGKAKMMRVFLGERDKWHGEPLYDAIVKRLRMMDIAGATVYRGILGYGAKGHAHKRSVFHPMRDLPIMLSVIDAPEKIAAAAEVVEGMLEDGLIVTSDVEMVRLVRGKAAMEAPDAARTTR